MEISVIIPAYNREATICRAIRSVFQQTFQDFELIIVDDYSQDGTIEAINTCSDPRIKIIRHHQNLGASAARNTAIKSSSGRYLAFLDSDDEWLPEKLSRQMGSIRSGQEGIIANVTGFYLFDEYNIKRKEMLSQPASWYKYLLMGLGVNPSNWVVSRKAFEHIGYFDPSLARYEDWDWLLRFTKRYPLTITQEALTVVYRGPQPRAVVAETATKRFLDKHFQEFRQFGSYGKRALGKRYFEVAIYYYLEGNRIAGWNWFRKAISQSLFLRPGMYLRMLDALMGTSIVPALIRSRALVQNR